MTLTATVAPSGSSASEGPTGYVSFFAGCEFLGIAEVGSDETANIVVSDLYAGTATITAVYDGDDTYSGTPRRLTETIDANATATTLAVTPRPPTSASRSP